jgi:hypothetical protein
LVLAPAGFFFAAGAGLRFEFAILFTLVARRSRVIAQVTPSSNHLKRTELPQHRRVADPATCGVRVHCVATPCGRRNCCAPRIMNADLVARSWPA